MCFSFAPRERVARRRAPVAWVVCLAACTGSAESSGPTQTTPPPTPPITITLSQTAVSLLQGATQQLVPEVTGSGIGSASWATSNPLVATVSNGLVRGVGVGTATITATARADTTRRATAQVTVTAPNTGGGVPTLGNGAPLSGLTAGEDRVLVYRIVVPAGSSLLEVVTTGQDGDADLYLTRTVALPGASQRSCASEGPGSNERCTVATPASGEWFAHVYGFTAFSNVTITATASAGGAVPPGFTVALTPDSVTLARGGSVQLRVALQRDSGFTGTITLFASGLPSGVSATFSPNPATGSASTLTLSAASTAAPGAFPFTVTGTTPGQSARFVAGTVVIPGG